MKKSIKIILVVSLIIICLITTSYGFGVGDLQGNPNGTDGISDIGNSVVRILTTIGIIVSVATLVIIGIKYMMGSVEEKAEYKKSLLPYVIGAGLVFAASVIAQIVYNVAKSI